MNDNLVAAKAAITTFLGAVGTFLGCRMIMLIVWVGLMCLDYLSGTIAARQNGTWKSEKARDGIGHKAGMFFVVIVSMVADFIILLICDNIPHDVLSIDWPMAIFPMVTMWYIITEIGSIIENAIEMGANVPSWLPKLLNATLHTVETVGDVAAEEAAKEPLTDEATADAVRRAAEEMTE